MNQDLIDEILAWKEVRNALVHKSCRRLYNNEEVKVCALDGSELMRKLTNAAASVNRAAEKMENP